MAACLLASLVSNRLHRSVVGWALVSHHDFGISIAFYRVSWEFQRCSLIALLRDVSLQNLPFVVHSAPEIVGLDSNFHEHFVEVPAPLLDPAHCLGSLFTDLICEIARKAIYPEADAFVANIYAALVKQALYVSQRKGKPDIHQHAKLDDLGRRFELAERALARFPRLSALFGRLKSRLR